MPKTLTSKKLDAAISQMYTRLAAGKSINIMDIGKVFKAARDAYATTADLAAVETAIASQVARLCVVL